MEREVMQSAPERVWLLGLGLVSFGKEYTIENSAQTNEITVRRLTRRLSPSRWHMVWAAWITEEIGDIVRPLRSPTRRRTKQTCGLRARAFLTALIAFGICWFSSDVKSSEIGRANPELVRVNELTLAIPRDVIYSYYLNPTTNTQSIVLLVPYDHLKFEPYRAPGPQGGQLFPITLRPETEASARLSDYESQIDGQTPAVRGYWDIYKLGGGVFDLYVNKSDSQPRYFTCPSYADYRNSLAICNVRQILEGDLRKKSGKQEQTTLIYQFLPPDIPRLAQLNQHVLDFVNGLLVSH